MMKFNDCCRPLLLKLMLTLNESSSFVCFLLLTLSSVSVLLANNTNIIVCPPETAYTPCYCNEYSPGVLTLDCLGRNLGDSRISEILDAFLLNDNSSALGEIELDLNQLTRVPDQIKYFPQLTLVSLDFNLITSLDSVAFNFTDAANPIRYLGLASNQLATIAPGAFQGNGGYGNATIIRLYSNKLTRFDATVFQSILEQMAPFDGWPNAHINVEYNPFNCSDCHLTWLIRDNRNFLPVVYLAKCSNGTRFEDLDPNGYVNCL